jgi:hypothetical protein
MFLEVLVQPKQNPHAPLKLMRKLLKKYRFVLDRMIADELPQSAKRRYRNSLTMPVGEFDWRWRRF